MHPNGRFLYAANADSDNISAYRINRATGALAEALPRAAAGDTPYTVAVDPTGRFAYAANANSDNISAYSIDQETGALTEVLPRAAAGEAPYSVTVDPSGRFVYSSNRDSCTVSVFEINLLTGGLTASGTITGRSGPLAMAMVKGAAPVRYLPGFLYVTETDSGSVTAYSIDESSGSLTFETAYAMEFDPKSLHVDPYGKFAYVPEYGSPAVHIYGIDRSTGSLTGRYTVETDSDPQAFAIDPSGFFAFMTQEESITRFSISRTSGNLWGSSYDISGAEYLPGCVTDPSGRFLYLTQMVSNNIRVYTIGTSSWGELTEQTTATATGGDPVSISVDPSGRFAYSANRRPDDVGIHHRPVDG